MAYLGPENKKDIHYLPPQNTAERDASQKEKPEMVRLSYEIHEKNEYVLSRYFFPKDNLIREVKFRGTNPDTKNPDDILEITIRDAKTDEILSFKNRVALKDIPPELQEMMLDNTTEEQA